MYTVYYVYIDNIDNMCIYTCNVCDIYIYIYIYIPYTHLNSGLNLNWHQNLAFCEATILGGAVHKWASTLTDMELLKLLFCLP